MGAIGPTYVLDKTAAAGGAIGQYRAVVLSDEDTAAQVTVAASTAIGVCQEEISAADVTAGRQASIRILGITYALAGAATTAGTRVAVDNAGRVVAATAGQSVLGIVLDTVTTANDPVAVLLTPGATA
jgi:hypothetical protein